MKKVISVVAVVLGLAAVVPMVGGCGGEDNASLLGAWLWAEASMSADGGTVTITTGVGGLSGQIAFAGTETGGSYTITITDASPEDSGTRTINGTWTAAGNVLTMTTTDLTATVTYTISGNQMTIDIAAGVLGEGSPEISLLLNKV